MKHWVDVVKPHDDIVSGDLEMAAFAADLGSVMRSDTGVRDVYADAVAFFRATYLTSSMRALLADVLGVLAGSGGDSVLQLRTPFGGGKTHSLLALYHIVTARDRLGAFEELSDLPDPGRTRVAVLSGVDLDPSSPRQYKDICTKTIWGELAWQLGGPDAYRLVSKQDQLGQAPGKEVLSGLFPVGQPTLLLLDEVLVYVEKAKALQVGDTTLGAQVLVFLHSLTELVGSQPQAAMVYSLQKSVLEAAGDESLLLALDHLVARVDAKREPVSGDEVMRVVQRRLFSDLGPDQERRDVASGYAGIYGRYRRQLADTDEQRREANVDAERFGERILASYPFHPALLDLMHQRWTTLPSYQRTRGALQFLATVVHSLLRGDHQTMPLIGPGDVAFEDEQVRGAFFSQVGDREGFTGVLERDLTGANAGVKEIDRRLGGDSHRLLRLRIGSRVASATMLYSFGGRTDEDRGVLESELVGALLAPDLDRNLLTTALADLREELLFLHYSGRRYRFDKTPNLNQLVANEADKFSADEVTDALRKETERRIGSSADALLWPKDGAQIPDHDSVFRVVYLDPSWTQLTPSERDHGLRELFEKRGAGAPRDFRNAVAFAVPGTDAMEHGRQAARRSLAVDSLAKQAKSLNISGEQLADLKSRGDAAARDLGATLDKAYQLVLLPVTSDKDLPYRFDEIDLSARLGLGRLLHDRVIEGLSAQVFDMITPEKLMGLLALGDGDDKRRFVPCEDVVSAAFSYLQFPKLRSAIVIRDAVARGVTKSVFGYTAMAHVEDGGVRTTADLVRLGKPTGSEEVDLGGGTFLLSASYARELGKIETAAAGDDSSESEEREGDGESQVTASTAGDRLTIELTVGKTEVFEALQILPALADESQTLDVSITISAIAKDKYDRTWIRNAVREPLDEAGIEGRVHVDGES
jgi:hypothetical protein